MSQIFLCYAKQDQGKVENVYRRLSAAGFKPWMRSKDIFPGEDTEATTQRAIKHSDFFLAFLSRDSVNQIGPLQKEIRGALDQWERRRPDHIYLIPVLLDACEVPDDLSRFEPVSYPSSEEEWEQIINAIKEGVRRLPPEIVLPKDNQRSVVIKIASDEKYEITMVFSGKPEDFDVNSQRFLQDVITSFLNIPSQDCEIKSVGQGSVKVTLELPAESAKKLLLAFENRDPKLFESLKPLMLIDVRQANVEAELAQPRPDDATPPPELPADIVKAQAGLYPGMILDQRYRIEREIGRGGFAIVYLARDQKLHEKHIVIKVLTEESASNTWLMKKFRDEIKALARINHPGVVGVQDAGETPDGKPYLVMQFVKGRTLRSVIELDRMELRRVAEIMRQIGQALSAAHEEGVWHRDLKPENIMLQDLGQGTESVTLIDFGIATIRDPKDPASGKITKVAGTPLYMAPEQIEGRPVKESDIYAMGVIAYELITGKLPFNPEPFSWRRLYELQQAGVKEKPKDLRPDLPVDAQTAILFALSFQPEDRYLQARDFGVAVAKALIPDEPPVVVKPSKASESQPMPSYPEPEMAYVLFMDIVEYTRQPAEQQKRLQLQLNDIVRSAGQFQQAQKKGQLISLPTGDGMALAFFGGPLAPVECAREIAQVLRRYPEMKLRMGVHYGFVYRVADIMANENLAGGGVNLAQRVMDCGDAGHILLSKAVADNLSELVDWREYLHDLGQHEVRHGVRVHLFNLYTGEVGNPKRPRKIAPPPA